MQLGCSHVLGNFCSFLAMAAKISPRMSFLVFPSLAVFTTLDLYHSLQLVRSAGRRSPELFLGLENGLETKDLEWHVSLFQNKYV